MMQVELHADISAFERDLRELQRGVERAVEQALDAGARLAARAAAETTSFRDASNDLRGSIGPGRHGRLSVFIEAGSEHALFVEKGTRQHGEGPYPITAKHAKALRFEMNGSTIIRRRVMHKGIQPRHFLRDAARNAEPEVRRLVMSGIDVAVRRFNG